MTLQCVSPPVIVQCQHISKENKIEKTSSKQEEELEEDSDEDSEEESDSENETHSAFTIFTDNGDVQEETSISHDGIRINSTHTPWIIYDQLYQQMRKRPPPKANWYYNYYGPRARCWCEYSLYSPQDQCRSCWRDWMIWEELQLFFQEEIKKARATYQMEKRCNWVYTADQPPEQSPSKTKIEEDIQRLLKEYPETIAQPDTPPGRTNIITHEIILEGTLTLSRPYYTRDSRKTKFIKSEIDQMLKDGIIQESKSPFVSSVLLVEKQKKEILGELRFCVDYRQLNKLTK